MYIPMVMRQLMRGGFNTSTKASKNTLRGNNEPTDVVLVVIVVLDLP
jgi:hypothetical protein